nr:hypothetical protein [Acinetobacter soli]
MDKCRKEFETLEDYQKSIKLFNERTRLDYEEFIHKQGQERQKLQLRFTPYTTKKGGYGVADLNHGLQTWQEQQKRIDELQARLDAALKETQHALRYVEADMRGNHEFLKMAMIRTLKSLAQALKGGEV